jgi:membrane protein implicated in regulation of membrane protease activity
MWIWWSVLGVILIVAEVFTTGFVLLWFGIGALAAALCGLAGIDSLPLQFLIFAVVSIALTAASRTIFAKYLSPHKTDNTALKMGVDSLPGRVGIVVSSSRGALHEGAVKSMARRGRRIRRKAKNRSKPVIVWWWKNAGRFYLRSPRRTRTRLAHLRTDRRQRAHLEV